MGQGYSMTTLSAASATIDVPELSDLVHEKTLASARFMKSIRARNQQGFVFVKAVMKPYPSFDVQKYVKQITHERNALAQIPNTLGYQRIVEVASGGFLARQYIYSSVYDRLSTRPFLEDVEKKWLAYQLLCAVRDCHAREIYHGDIKTENLLVTSWNWLYLTDFSSSFKPTTLPEDNPADFAFYFDTSSRRTCYVAPERFTANGADDFDDELNWSMDMFSVGCAIAEMFLEGPIFSLSQIFKYKAGEYNPEHTHLHKIEDPDVRAMVLNMIDLDPERRYNADQHLSFYKGRIFPDYFDSFLHQYMLDLTDPPTLQHRFSLGTSSLGESDNKIDRVYYDLDKISYFLGYGNDPDRLERQQSTSPSKISRKNPRAHISDASLYDGTLLFLTIVSSSLRNCTRASSRLKACDLLVAFARRLPDEAKLDRIIPFIAIMLSDGSDAVQAAAIRALADVLEMIEVVSPINAFIVPEYIFPRLKIFVELPPDSVSPLVRAAYASSLASLALSSNRLLDIVQAIRADGRLPALSDNDWAPATSFHALYDPSKEELVKHFEEATVALVTDEDISVKRALLGSISRLCVFFGSPKSSEVILTHLNTYLNEKDWLLKCSFFDALVGVASYVGTSSLEQFILPIMIGSLTDPEAFVVEKVFRSLARMADLGLLQRSTIWELAGMAARFTVHPSIWIRESAVQFIVVSAKYASKADKYCILVPIIQPFLKTPVMDITEEQILDHLKKPLSRPVLNAALHWAGQRSKSLFWTAASRDSSFMIPEQSHEHSNAMAGKRILSRIPPSQKDRDDQTSLDMLRNLGMLPEDELKLLALREYLLRIAADKSSDENETQMPLNGIMSLHQIDITPQNVLFDFQQPVREIKSRPQVQRSMTANGQTHTIADALMDASTTNAGPISRQTTAATPAPIDIRGRPDRQTTELQSPEIKIEGSGPSSLTSRNNSIQGRFSPGELDKLSLRRGKLELRHRNSGINLLSRTDTGKAEAEISTTQDTAFGSLDGPASRRITAGTSALSLTANVAAKSRSKSPISRESRTPTYVPNHSYTGTDANVLRLLDSHFAENYPIDEYDFGKSRVPTDTTQPIRKATDVPPLNTGNAVQTTQPHKEWRPSGQLLTQFAEHTAAINRVCVAPDHAFFVTASDDGTCKIWDTLRLEKNVTPRSRHTYRQGQDVKIKSLCFIEESHTFVSGADDGSIHAVRIEYKSIDGGADAKYGKPVMVRDYTIPPQNDQNDTRWPEHAVQLHHYRTASSQSILIVATSECRILLIDLKNMTIVHTLHSPLHYGSITSLVVDKKQHWLLIGTSHGIMSLWDLRFKLRLRSFGVSTNARIDALCIDPYKGHGKWIMVSAAGEISVWDLEKIICREVLRPSTFGLEEKEKAYESWNPDDESPEKLISRFAKDITQNPNLLEPYLRPGTPDAKDTKSEHQIRNSTHHNQLFAAVSTPALFSLTSHTSTGTKHPILITGSSDLHLRYWDLSHPEQSFVISGPSILKEESSKPIQPRYTVSHPLSLSPGAQIQLVQETSTTLDDSSRKDAARGTPSKRRPNPSRTTTGASTPVGKGKEADIPDTSGSTRSNSTAEGAAGASGSGSGSRSKSEKPMRNTIINNTAQQLLRTHMDGITDVVVLRKPYGCVVSVDRGGNIYVFH